MMNCNAQMKSRETNAIICDCVLCAHVCLSVCVQVYEGKRFLMKENEEDDNSANEEVLHKTVTMSTRRPS